MTQKGPKSPFLAIFTTFGVFWVKGVKMGFWAKRGISVEMGFSGYMAQNGLFWPILRVYGSEWAKMGLFWLI